MRARLAGLIAVAVALAALPAGVPPRPRPPSAVPTTGPRAAARCAYRSSAAPRTAAAASCACTSASSRAPTARGRRSSRSSAPRAAPAIPRSTRPSRTCFMLGRLHRAPRPDRHGQPRHRPLGRDQLQAPPGRQGGLRARGRPLRAAARAPRANAYGTGAAADDLAAVLDKLGVPVVNVYGDSYGTYFAQTFAVRHRERVRAVVLDAAFPVTGFDPWARQESVALRFAWPETCRRSTGCGGVDALAELRRWALRLDAPSRSWPPAATPTAAATGSGSTAPSLGQMAGDGSLLLHDLPRPAGRAARVRARRSARRSCAWPPRTSRTPAAAR